MPKSAMSRRQALAAAAASAFAAPSAGPGMTIDGCTVGPFVDHPTDHQLVLTTTIDIPVEKAWWAWTTQDGMRALGWESNIELRIGGPYEIFFDPAQLPGLKGGEGLHVLSFIPRRMLSTEWNAPPKFGEIRGVHTWIVVEFAQMRPLKTALTLTQLGWGHGANWSQVYAYFQQAWPVVFERLRSRLR